MNLTEQAANAADTDLTITSALAPPAPPERAPHFRLTFECRAADGSLRWTEEARNVVTTQGKVELLERFFRGSSYTAAWFLLLAGTGTKAASDTLASHAAWPEINPYAGNRPAIVWNAAAANGANGRIISNAVAFSITSTATIAGAGICNVASTNSGVLYSVVDFAAPRSLGAGDTLNVTMTVDYT